MTSPAQNPDATPAVRREPEPLGPVMRWASILAVWLGSAVGAVLIGALSPAQERLGWVGLTLGAATAATLCIQLATRQKQGFVDRLSTSVVGAVVILAVASAAYLLGR
ncbi:MAG: hypothetical protein ABI255_06635 [Microbacteriaceae bacterium]